MIDNAIAPARRRADRGSAARSLAMVIAATWSMSAAAASSAAPATEPMFEYTVGERDTLIGISNGMLTSPSAWRSVARLNRLAEPNFIVPGQVLRIPLRLARAVPVTARLISVTGDVRIGDALAAESPASAGAALSEGQTLRTADGGSAVLELDDGSRMKLPPSSLAEVVASRRVGVNNNPGATPSTGWFTGALRVLRGSVEVFATKVLRAKPLEVTTPTAVVGVRGTHYRVSYDAAAANQTRAEVLDGTVRFDAAGASFGTDLTAGFGASIDSAVPAPIVSKLLAAPDLAQVPERFERPLIHFDLPAGTGPVRVQVAADGGFDRIVLDQRVAAGAEVRLAGLDDGTWNLRARRLDANAVEGFDASKPFVLKARPEPPASMAPRSEGKQTAGAVRFAWAPNLEARDVRLQVADDPAFAHLVVDQGGIATPETSVKLDVPGPYFWRVASVRPNGDQGPFGDPSRFELRPEPAPPQGGLADDGASLAFRWSGRSQDRQRAQLARDPAFTEIVAEEELASPQWTLPTPGSHGSYYFRYQTIEPDGFVSPWSSTLTIEVPRDWKPLLLLVPLLLL